MFFFMRHHKMLRTPFILVIILLASNCVIGQLPAELQTPELVSINRMPMRASAFGFENIELAKGFDKEKSGNYFSLN